MTEKKTIDLHFNEDDKKTFTWSEIRKAHFKHHLTIVNSIRKIKKFNKQLPETHPAQHTMREIYVKKLEIGHEKTVEMIRSILFTGKTTDEVIKEAEEKKDEES